MNKNDENAVERTRPLLLRAGEVARILGVSRALAYRLMASGSVPVTRWGRSVRVPRAGLDEWIRRNTSSAA